MRILLFTDFGPETYTGYGTVSKNIVYYFEKMRKDVQFDIVGINHFKEGTIKGPNYELISAQLNDKRKDEFGRTVVMDKLMQNNYDFIWIINDLGVINPFLPVLQKIREERKKHNKKSFKIVFYFPVDSELWPQTEFELLNNLHICDFLYTYTEFARTEVKKYRPELTINVVPHGVNTKDFHKLEPEVIREFRSNFFGPINRDKVIIGVINRNQPRKDIITSIFAFEQAKKELKVFGRCADELYLYLHMNPKDPLGHNLIQVLAQTSLKEGEDYDFIPPEFDNRMASVEELNLLYNSIDCLLITTLGEGWGLTYHEGSAVGVKIIYPVHTSLKEMSNNGKHQYVAITELEKVCLPSDNIIRYQSNVKKVSTAIQYLCLGNMVDMLDLDTRMEEAKDWAIRHNWRDIVKNYWLPAFK